MIWLSAVTEFSQLKIGWAVTYNRSCRTRKEKSLYWINGALLCLF